MMKKCPKAGGYVIGMLKPVFAITVLIMLAASSLMVKAESEEEAIPDIGSRLELFVDDYLIDSMDGVELQLHHPQRREKVLDFIEPWEGIYSGIVVVVKDEDKFHMWYRGHAPDYDFTYVVPSLAEPDDVIVPGHDEMTCYAESKDGIHWTKPNLGLVEFNGSKKNNIIMEGFGHAFAPFIDKNPDTKPSERFKAVAVGRYGENDEHRGLFAFSSADGIHWTKMQEEPILTDGAFDSLNIAFWDTHRQKYVAFYRDFIQGVRSVKFSTSDDFLHWEKGQWFDYGDTPPEQIYTNAINAYPRAPHIYMSFPMRFQPWKTFHKDSNKPGLGDGVFMTSRDGVHWDRRFMEAFIRPGRDPKNWIQRACVTAPWMVQTSEDEISLYVHRNNSHPDQYYERQVIRTDGFVSAHADYEGGTLTTKPFRASGTTLVLNFETSAAGSIQVEILNEAGHPFPGFELVDSPLVFGDLIAGEVAWERPNSMTDTKVFKQLLEDGPIRLRFTMRDADLYSFRFK